MGKSSTGAADDAEDSILVTLGLNGVAATADVLRNVRTGARAPLAEGAAAEAAAYPLLPSIACERLKTLTKPKECLVAMMIGVDYHCR